MKDYIFGILSGFYTFLEALRPKHWRYIAITIVFFIIALVIATFIVYCFNNNTGLPLNEGL